MRITFSGSFTDKPTRDRVEELIRFGFGGLDHRRVEVHVKARLPKRLYRVRIEPCVEYPAGLVSCSWTRRLVAEQHPGRPVEVEEKYFHHSCSGYAYDGVSYRENVARGVEYLVTMHVPLCRDRSVFTGPADVVFTAAHEHAHVDQFRSGARRNPERRANAYAEMRVARWREAVPGGA